jgi:hypothetical protein
MGHTVTYPLGSLGLDYVQPPVSEQRMAADGWRYVIRYIAQRTTIGKLVTPTEIVRIHNAGLGLILNYEWSADRAKEGAPAGTIDGKFSRKTAEELGYPHGSIILCSSFDAGIFYGSASMATVAERYARAFADELGPYRFGAYAGTRVIDRIKDISALNWKPLATSWSTWPTDATIHVRQRRPTAVETARMPYATPSTVDVNVTLAPVDAWLPTSDPVPEPPVPPTPPPSEPDDMTPVDFRAYDSRQMPEGAFTHAGEGRSIPIPFATPGKPVMVNITAISANTNGGYFAVSWDGHMPATSRVTLTPGETTDNLCYVGTNPGGAIDVYLGGDPQHQPAAHLVIDVQGVAM